MRFVFVVLVLAVRTSCLGPVSTPAIVLAAALPFFCVPRFFSIGSLSALRGFKRM